MAGFYAKIPFTRLSKSAYLNYIRAMFQWVRRAFDRKSATISDVTFPEPWLHELFGAVPAASGVAVSVTTALAVPAVQSAIRVISESAASLPAKVKRIEGRVETDAPDHPVQRLINIQPNEWSSWFELVRDLVADQQMHDAGGLAWVNRTGSGIAEVIKFDHGTIQADRKRTGEWTYKIDNHPLDAATVIHLRGPFSKSPLSLAREAIGTALVMERHQARFFANGAQPSGVLHTDKNVGDVGVARILAGWRAAQSGPDNAGKTPLLWDGVKYAPLTVNSTDAQFLELRKFVINEVARAFRVPPSMLFELDRATWSNSEQMGKEFLTYCLEPVLQALEGALRRALFAPDERPLYRVVFDRDDLTRASLTERATAINSLRSSEVLSADEARSWLDLPPRADGKGGTYENPNITVRPATPVKAAA